MKIRPKQNCCNNGQIFDTNTLLNGKKVREITIVWRRLVIDGNTCPRCSNTEIQLEEAKKQLKSLGFEIHIKKEIISYDEFKQHPLVSNEIIINGISLEHWLNATVGKSSCCSVCGDEDCRTIETDGNVYEVIPSDLLVKAVMIASEESIK